MPHKPNQQLLAATRDSGMDDLDRSISGRAETTYSAPFVNSFSSSFSDIPLYHVDKNGHEELPHPIAPTHDWPREPMSLRASLNRSESCLKIIWDYLMIIFSTLLLVKLALVIAAWRTDRDHKGIEIDQVSHLTIALIKVNTQMVTIFTIIFVAIISTTIQRYTLYKAQHGASIAELEQLQGSISPLTTLKLIWMLKSVTSTSATLIIIWVFYYLGSQANTLEYRFEQSVAFQHLDAITPHNSHEGASTIFISSENVLPTWETTSIGANAAMSEYHYEFTVQPGSDLYGFPLVPDLSTLAASQTLNPDTHAIYHPDQSGWFDVSKQSQISKLGAYSNMIGWPFGIGSDAKSTLIAPSTHWLGDLAFSPTYLHVDCLSPTVQSDEAFPDTIFPNQTMTLRMVNNTQDTPVDQDGYHQKSFEFWLRPVPGLTVSLSNTSVTVCNISHMTVDLQVNCQISGCYAQAVRWANGTDAGAATSFHTPFTNDNVARLFFDNFVENYDSGSTNGFKSTIFSSISQFLETSSRSNDVSTAPARTALQAQLHQVFTIYFNTYFTASQMVNKSVQYDPSIYDRANFYGALYQPQYIISWAWILMDLISCLILLSAAVLSLVLRTRTLAPDIFNSISSLVRDSPQSGLPNNATGLSGLQRTLLMKKVIVQLGDVSGHGEEIGRIALRRVDMEDGMLKTLNEWTKYH